MKNILFYYTIFRNADTNVGIEHDTFDYYDYEDDYSAFMDAFGDALTCPYTPLDNATESPPWTDTCDDVYDIAEYEEYLTNSKSNHDDTKTSNSNQKSKETFKLKNVLGAGINRGLSVIVDTLECGWHSTSLFDGVKVYYINIWYKNYLLLLLNWHSR